MRKKLREDRKRKNLSTTISPELWELLNKYSEQVGKNKSRIIEEWIKNGLKNKETIQKLLDDGILLPDSNLLE